MRANALVILGVFYLLGCRQEIVSQQKESKPSIDNDGDGFPIPEDCDDIDSSINPSAEEFCDGLDNNCNGEIDEGVLALFYLDSDGDGFGDPEQPIEACSIPSGYVPSGTDCDDSSADIFPGAREICNDIDDDCDDSIDEDLVEGLFYDADGDGHGDPNQPSTDCQGGDEYVYYADDCDDTDPSVNPFAEEVCDSIDNDCNGLIDDGVSTTYYADADEDGYGDASNPTSACELPQGYVENFADCDDNDPMQYPNADEYCNNEDDDCDEDIDEDPIDSPTWYYDIDGDGYGSSFITAFECNAPLGYLSDNSDCDDTNTSIYPGATEYCNNLDNDCNGQIDDNAVDAFTWYADFDRDDYGDPNNSLYQCDQPFDYVLTQQDCDDSDNEVNPDSLEYCNGVDDNCDGQIDNGTIDSIDYFLDSDGDGYGDSAQVISDCAQPPGYILDGTDCDDSDAAIYPGAQEYCDGIDQNCNGNNFYEEDLDGNGLMACQESVWFRNDASNLTNPYGACSQAADLLLAQNITIQQYYHGNNTVTSSLLQHYGLYVHHGRNVNGAVAAYTNAEAYALQDWVYNGGRLLYIGYSSNQLCDIADSLPSQFGLSCNPSGGYLSGTTSVFTSHPITNGLTTIGGEGGESWSVGSPAQSLATINGQEFVMAVEYGQGKVVVIANEWPFYNANGGYTIGYGDNFQLVENIWNWLLES